MRVVQNVYTASIYMDTELPCVVVIGHVCIDHNSTESNSYANWGSSALYIAQYLHQQYGITPSVVTEYGADMLQYIPEGIQLLPKTPTQPKTLRYENDTRVIPRIWRCFNAEFSPEPVLDSDAIEVLQKADIVFVATLLPNYSPDFLKQVLQYTKSDALRVLCPQGSLRQIDAKGLVHPRVFVEAPEILPLFALAIYSEEDIATAMHDAIVWTSRSTTKIIVTQGETGATICERGQKLYIPTTPLEPDQIIDSVGCGDVFQAAAAYEYFCTQNLSYAVRAGHSAASAKLTATMN